jgi:hypothetical protein
MKNCKICNNEFEQKIVRGNEQIYCSDKCRQQGYLRRKSAATTGATTGATTNGVYLQNPNNLQARFNAPGEVDRTSFTNFSHNPIEQLEKTYEAKNEALRFELQLASALKEIDELKTKNNVLAMQLETMDDEELEESGNFLAGVMKNPQPVIMAVNLLIDKSFEVYERVQSKNKK